VSSSGKKSFLQRISNRWLHLLARVLPGATTLRPWLHRRRGVRIHGRVFIGDDVYIENEYPEAIELHDGAQITVRAAIIAHTRGAGRVVIGKDAFIGSNAVIVCSPGSVLTVGEGAVVAACSLVTVNVPPHVLFGGERAKPLMRAEQALTLETSYAEFVGGLRPLSTPPPPPGRREAQRS